MFTGIRKTWNAMRRRNSWESDLAEELQSHIENRAADLQRTGLAPAEAVRRAQLEMGSRERYRDECRRSYRLRWLDEFRQDLRYAARTLRRSPAFTSVAVLSLALGIGANTVVFTFLNTLILRPLPVTRPAELLAVVDRGSTHSYPTYRELRDHNTAFAGLIGYRVAPMGIDTETGPRRIWGYLVSGNYFDVLGIRPARGRFFHPEEDRVPNGSPFAVLSYTSWQARYGGDPAIVGRTVRINKLPYTILGVAPRGFIGTETFYVPEIWVPMMMQPQIEGRASWLENRNMTDVNIIGRLRQGVTPAQATANLNGIAQALGVQFPNEDAGMRLRLVKPGLFGDQLRGPAEAFLGGIMLLAMLVLLAACANLASLLAARATDRHFEIAIRLSIGAGRGRLLRQLLTEAFAISALGGAAGCALAFGALKLLANLPTPAGLPIHLGMFAPDRRVLLFALAASIATAFIFGIVPAHRAVIADPNGSLRGSAPGKTGQRRWAARDFLLAGQVALCCFLVTASIVSVRGLGRALETPLGIQPRQLYAAAFQLGLAGYSSNEGAAFQKRALDSIAQLPGVTSAAYGDSVPLDVNQNGTSVYPDGTVDLRAEKAMNARYFGISPAYLRTVGAHLLAGRDFDWHDDAKAPAVAIVNQTFARRIMRTENPLGHRYLEYSGAPVQVVGLVQDGKYMTLTEDPRPAVFRPALQAYDEATYLLVRSAAPEAELTRGLRRAVAALDPQLPLYACGSVHQMIDLAYLPARAATIALGSFGLLALMLAVTGIYGLAAYTVSRRVREIGIRVAVGARAWQVLGSVLGRIGVMLGAGSAVGLAMGLTSAKLLASIVYQATPRDPMVLGGVAATMIAVTLISAWIPARRATSVDPIRSLRHE